MPMQRYKISARSLTPEQIFMAEAMTADPAISTRQMAKQFGIHHSMSYRHLNAC